jgi:ATP-dependent helicase/nuclease subunit B
VSTVRVIPASANLLESVAEHLNPEENDFSSFVVVFPGKRPAHVLRKMLAARTGGAILPPRIFSIDHFVEFLPAGPDVAGRKPLQSVDAAAILYDTYRQITAQEPQPQIRNLRAFLPLGMKLFSELEELVLADLSPRRVSQTVGDLPFARFRPLALYYERFYEEVERRGFRTRATTYRRAADQLDHTDLSSHQNIILAGFYAFTAVERRIVGHLRQLENVVLIFQEGVGLNRQLKDLGIDVPADQGVEEGPEPEIHLYRAPDQHGQVMGLASLLREQHSGEGVLDEHTAVVLPSADALFPVFHLATSMLREGEFNISMGYPLARTPVYGFMRGLMDLIRGSFQHRYSARAYLDFVLHPYTKNIRLGNRSDLSRVMFHTIENYLSDRKAKLLLTLEEIEGDGELLKRMERAMRELDPDLTVERIRAHLVSVHNALIRRFSSFASVSDFATRGLEVLNYIAGHSTAPLHPDFRAYAGTMTDVLDQLRLSLLSDRHFDETADYFNLLDHVVREESVSFPGTPLGGLQVLGLLETRGLKFDTVYMVDVNDDVLPAGPGENLLLPQQVRTKLGLETHRDRERLQEYYFNLVLRGARKVHLFYTESEGGRREKSRFVQKLIWRQEQRRERPLEGELEKDIRYRLNLVTPRPGEICKTKEMVDFLRSRNSFSASQLDAYLRCPLQFYYESVLRLREISEAADEVDARDVGTLVHRILHRFFASCTGRILGEDQLRAEELDRTAGECFTEVYGTELLGPALFLRAQVQRQLRQFLDAYQLPMVRDHRIEIREVEKDLSAEKGGFRFVGRVDRIELRDGKPYILDYNTGRDDQRLRIRVDRIDPDDPATWAGSIGSFQLPLYMLLYASDRGAALEEVTPAYLFLGRQRLDLTIESGIGDGEHSAVDVYKAVEPVIRSMLEEIANPELPFRPTTDPQAQCPSCPFHTICGTQWTLTLRGER